MAGHEQEASSFFEINLPSGVVPIVVALLGATMLLTAPAGGQKKVLSRSRCGRTTFGF